MRKPTEKSIFPADPISFAKTIVQLKRANIMESDHLPLHEKLKLAIAMKISQHVGQVAGKEVWDDLQVEELIDHASFSKVIRIRYGNLHHQFSRPVDDMYDGNAVDHSSWLVQDIVREVVPMVLIAWAAGVGRNETIEIKL